MGIPARNVLSAVLCLAISSALAAQQNPIDQAPLVIAHVTVIDATGGPARPGTTVVVLGNRIAALGADEKIAVPKAAHVVDGTGKFLIPGLWDMHVHLNYKDYLPLFIANGVTGVRVMWGQPQHHEWRKQIEAGSLLGPHMKIASPIIDGPNPYWPGSISVKNEAQARQAVAMSKRYGADFVKVYQFLPRDLYFDIADESKKEGIPFEGHLPVTVTAEEGSRAGQKVPRAAKNCFKPHRLTSRLSNRRANLKGCTIRPWVGRCSTPTARRKSPPSLPCSRATVPGSVQLLCCCACSLTEMTRRFLPIRG